MSDDDQMSIIEFSEDISTAEEPEPLPEGEYPASITAVERKESQKGNAYAAVTFTVQVEDFPADFPSENAPDGMNMVYRRVVLEDNPRSRWGLRQFCEAIGATPSKTINLNDWIGLSATVTVVHDTYEGSTRANIISVDSE